MSSNITSRQKGFIALFSVIIISTVLLLSAVSLNFSGFFGRMNVFNSELKAESDAVALSCLGEARLKLADDTTFITTGAVVNVDSESCTYDVLPGGRIKTNAEVNDAFTYHYAEVDLNESDIPITLFKECADLSPCP